MKAKGIVPNVGTYNGLMNALASERDIVTGYALLEEMTRAGLAPTVPTFNALLRCCSSPFDVKRAFALYEMMQRRFKLKPTLRTRESLLLATAEGGRLDVALRLLQDVLDDGHLPHSAVYLGLFNAAIRHADPPAALVVLRELELTGASVANNVYWRALSLFTTHLHAEGTAFALDKVAARTDELVAAAQTTGGCRSRLDRGILAAVLDTAVASGELELARAGSELWLEAGYEPREAELALINSAAQANDVSTALRLMCEADENGCGEVLSVDELMPVVDAIGASPETAEAACDVLEAAIADGSAPTISAFNVILQACARIGETERMAATFKEAVAQGVVPTAETFDALLLGYATFGQMHEVGFYDKLMADSGFSRSPASYAALLLAAVRSETLETVEAMLTDAAAAKVAVPVVALETVFKKAIRVEAPEVAKLVVHHLGTAGLTMPTSGRAFAARYGAEHLLRDS
ncbi:uncharacterized protein AMSG_03911 [Thecamonas trahens ATCC 50062]|uniref:Pentatricopeptide repeat-containing protein-mitochondrial domain-containing protein n=1 Tax=Thecamonas trahens ATCC 50062 TaxID=461836 RepID=A0A0L0D665_THETB|nr:hypothetical protein AMSG_03911 [Thecamonas trahens ATCC 50062]KNC47680.1 hypothetical protein AMSG_03911 [Thecamonas trahens ATCC 50062]|eukprot:XP_013759164.1 hypothetical protein AMSG_03911 [Thecamonas trahens ATCC 50062]